MGAFGDDDGFFPFTLVDNVADDDDDALMGFCDVTPILSGSVLYYYYYYWYL